MIKKMPNSVGKALMLWLVAGTASLALAQSSSASQQTPGQRTAGQTFKNIQVLKDVPSDELIPAMQFISASLGVECGFCHVENHFEQDDKKPKLIARKMMLMMAAINKENFDGHRVVTCNTCHLGSRVPQAIPAVSEGSTAPRDDENGKASAPLPSATDIVQKYVEASGGEKTLRKISTRTERGTTTFAGREIAIDLYDKAPDRRASFMHFPNGESATVFDGQSGWTGFPGRPPRPMPDGEIQGAKIDADLQFPLHVHELFPDLRPAPSEKVEGREAYQLVSEKSGQPQIRLYFDAQSGLLVRMVRYSDSPLGLNPVRVDYGDYRPVDGVQVPYRWTIARPSGQFTIQLTDVKQNVEIDDAKFAKPAATEGNSRP